jgi:Putative 2OG-Fe(II) oxygenase
MTHKFIKDFTLLELTARQYLIENIDNDKLAEEVLKFIEVRMSDDPNNNLSEDSKIDPVPGSETEKLIKAADEIGALKNFKTEHAWGQIHRPLESTNTHNHGISPYAWVYYVKVPPGSGDLTFWFFDRFKCSVQPKENHLVVFPGWMNHSVSKNRGDEIRISVSGNFAEIDGPQYVYAK